MIQPLGTSRKFTKRHWHWISAIRQSMDSTISTQFWSCLGAVGKWEGLVGDMIGHIHTLTSDWFHLVRQGIIQLTDSTHKKKNAKL